jgi:hypothetical protein
MSECGITKKEESTMTKKWRGYSAEILPREFLSAEQEINRQFVSQKYTKDLKVVIEEDGWGWRGNGYRPPHSRELNDPLPLDYILR